MGLLSRLKVRVGALLAPAQDPRQAPRAGCEEQAELLQQVQDALADVSAAKLQLAAHTARLREALPGLEEQARQALAAGREDLARLTLQRRHAAALELRALEERVFEVAQEEQTLLLAERSLAARIEAFRARQEVASARYTAAEAQVRIAETLAGVSDGLAQLSGALERTEAKTQYLRARASTLEGLLQPGLDPGLASPPDAVERELACLDADREVDAQLSTLKTQLALPAAPAHSAIDPSRALPRSAVDQPEAPVPLPIAHPVGQPQEGEPSC